MSKIKKKEKDAERHVASSLAPCTWYVRDPGTSSIPVAVRGRMKLSSVGNHPLLREEGKISLGMSDA
jgi:hypothetical protein